jgi:hypothetical protein
LPSFNEEPPPLLLPGLRLATALFDVLTLGWVSVAKIIDVKFADSDQLIRGFGGKHHQLA